MNEHDIAYFKEKLETQLKDLEAELSTIGRRNPENPQDWEALPEDHDPKQADENEVADNIEAFEENTAILKELEIKYNETKEALERIKNGTYGVCEVSGETIEKDRLEANPGARTCKAHINE